MLMFKMCGPIIDEMKSGVRGARIGAVQPYNGDKIRASKISRARNIFANHNVLVDYTQRYTRSLSIQDSLYQNSHLA
jgi:hypothetical protein